MERDKRKKTGSKCKFLMHYNLQKVKDFILQIHSDIGK